MKSRLIDEVTFGEHQGDVRILIPKHLEKPFCVFAGLKGLHLHPEEAAATGGAPGVVREYSTTSPRGVVRKVVAEWLARHPG